MTPRQKAVAILALAGEENASKLVQNIPEYEVKKILKSFNRLPTLTEQDINNIAKEFLQIIKNLGSDSNRFSIENAKRILYAANNSIKDNKWIESISDSFLIDAIRNILNEMDEKILSSWLKSEHPQTISLVLSICPPKKSNFLFKSLHHSLYCEMILRISQINQIDTPELENLYEELEKLQKNNISQQTYPSGFEKILSVLQTAPVEQKDKLLKGIELKDPELAKKLVHSLLSPSRLVELEPIHLSLLCSNLSDKIISLAMRIEQPKTKEKFLSSLSKKRRHLIEEEMKSNKQLKKDAEIATSLIVKKALELRDSGKIVFPWEVTLV